MWSLTWSKFIPLLIFQEHVFIHSVNRCSFLTITLPNTTSCLITSLLIVILISCYFAFRQTQYHQLCLIICSHKVFLKRLITRKQTHTQINCLDREQNANSLQSLVQSVQLMLITADFFDRHERMDCLCIVVSVWIIREGCFLFKTWGCVGF